MLFKTDNQSLAVVSLDTSKYSDADRKSGRHIRQITLNNIKTIGSLLWYPSDTSSSNLLLVNDLETDDFSVFEVDWGKVRNGDRLESLLIQKLKKTIAHCLVDSETLFSLKELSPSLLRLSSNIDENLALVQKQIDGFYKTASNLKDYKFFSFTAKISGVKELKVGQRAYSQEEEEYKAFETSKNCAVSKLN